MLKLTKYTLKIIVLCIKCLKLPFFSKIWYIYYMNGRKLLTTVTLIVFFGAFAFFEFGDYLKKEDNSNDINYSVNTIPDYSGEDVIILNNNEPNFGNTSGVDESFELYGELDNLGRCTTAIANIGYDLMPTTKRESIRDIKPTGFRIVKYDIIKDGLYLYNRCHLIAYMLTGEDLNKENLITCTDMLNKEIMLEYEKKVFNYIKKTHNHVLYRVTPIYENDNLIATGIEIEALSIEDNGEGIKFNMFFYNIEDGVEINYLNGESKLVG